MWRRIRPFLPSIGAWVIAGGLEVSGVEIPWLGFSLMVVGVILLAIPLYPWLRDRKRGNLEQSIAIKPFARRRHANWDKTEHFMWAELQVTNTSVAELKDVEVNITKCLTLQEIEDSSGQDSFVMFDFLNLPAFCVYWSERQAQPKQIALSVPKGATRSALVAFEDNPNGRSFNFNTANYNWIVGGVKIDIEVSSCETVLWRGEFYIECHPNYVGGDRAKFEFEQWGSWRKSHHVIDNQTFQTLPKE